MTVDEAAAMPDAEDLRDLRQLACSILENYAADALTAPRQAIPFDESLWQTLTTSGLTLLSTPVPAGGSGGGIAEAAALLSATAEYAAPGPIAETDLLAAWLLTVAQLDVPDGPLTSATCEVAVSEADGGVVRVAGTADRVPWARDCDSVVVLGTTAPGEVVIRIPADRCSIVPGRNVAHEPRDAVRFDLDLPRESVVPVSGGLAPEWLLRGALARSVQTCGAMESALALTIEHASQRIQFGRPLGRFQAVQHLVAEAAGEVTAARAACEVAVRTAVQHGIASPAGELAVAVAKSQSARAADVVSRVSHQVHGAIGFTLDHRLRHFTLRMLAWRGEYGGARDWERRVGAFALAAGADLWPLATSGRPDPAP